MASVFRYLFDKKISLIPWKFQARVRQATVKTQLSDTDATIYPQVSVPTVGTPIVLPGVKTARNKNTQRGMGEYILTFYVFRHFLRKFYDDTVIIAGSHHYVADLAFIDEEHGVYIDIENDEPYVLNKKIPTHCIGSDDMRNRNVAKAGWIVVHFSEQQCISNPAGCLRYVYEVAQQMAPAIRMPRCLRHATPIPQEKRWDEATARMYASKNRRRAYQKAHFLTRIMLWLSDLLYHPKRTRRN